MLHSLILGWITDSSHHVQMLSKWRQFLHRGSRNETMRAPGRSSKGSDRPCSGPRWKHLLRPGVVGPCGTTPNAESTSGFVGHARVIADPFDFIALGIVDVKGSPLDPGMLGSFHRHTKLFYPTITGEPDASRCLVRPSGMECVRLSTPDERSRRVRWRFRCNHR